MPYHILRRGNKYQVVGETGKIHGTHPSKANATRQLRALYANVPDASLPKPKKIVWRKRTPTATPRAGGGGMSGMNM